MSLIKYGDVEPISLVTTTLADVADEETQKKLDDLKNNINEDMLKLVTENKLG